MDFDPEDVQRAVLGDLTMDLLDKLIERAEVNVDDEEFAPVIERVNEMNPHERAAFSLSQVLGQLAIKHNDQRLFYAGSACLWFSGVLDGEIMGGNLLEAMEYSEGVWKQIQSEVDEIMTEAVDNLLP